MTCLEILDNLSSYDSKMSTESKLQVGRPNIGNLERFLQRVNVILDQL
jgi:hypothetical protein